MVQVDKWKKITTILLFLLCFGLFAVFLKAYLDGNFHSVETLQRYVGGFGIWAPLILIAIQAVQVVFPILPGFLGCIVGALMFGWMGGFWCNYIGISLGSILAFLFARKCGEGIIHSLFPNGKYDKFSTWAAENKFYTLILFLGMLLPLFPDDFFCYFTGITKMSAKKFIMIIILGKPWCILVYSIMFSKIPM